MSSDGFDKTELPTQRRREEARARGQFAYSHELVNGLLLLVGAVGIWWTGSSLAAGLTQEIQAQLRTPHVELTVDDAPALLSRAMNRGIQLTGGLLLAVFVVGLAANLAQSGLHFNTESLGPKWEKINPAENWNKVLSAEGLMRGGMAVAKVVLLGVTAWWVLSDRGTEVVLLGSGLLSQAVAITWGIAIELCIAAGAVFVVIGAVDFGYQWYRNEQSLRMSREELKRERKDDEGDPNILARRRQRALELVSQRRMLQEVQKATLVITNPTHIAVALRYERGVTGAPVVIAKGRDQFALQIAAKARRHGIPVLERKPVARALYKMVKVGKEIPQSLYVAVSEVLGYVYRLRGLSA